MTKVVHIQKSARSAGGSALRLHKAFLQEGLNTFVLSLFPDENDTERIFYPGRFSKLVTVINDKLNLFLSGKGRKEYGLFSYTMLGIDITQLMHVKEADIIIIHWVQGEFLSVSAYRKLAKLGKPVIIVMHDMWTFTGGCHYSFSCEKYKSECYDCQIFADHKRFDLSKKGFSAKRKLFLSCGNFLFISPSKWLQSCANESSLLKAKHVYHIPNILDDRVFKPFHKSIARQIIDIDNDARVIAFGAVTVDSPYKGWDYLRKALEILDRELGSDNILLLVFGKGVSEKMADSIPFRKRFMGYLKDETSLALVYNAADVFVTPSLADNLPTTVLESLACGTPVVGFKTGGIPEMIKHKENGYLADYKDAVDLSNGLRYCLDSGIKGRLLPEFRKEDIIGKYIRIVNEAMMY
ncbi:MAG: glycosyltransferase [Bacteroidales bacterium]|nr:glycosyltransferase [Bacteroidales bacterium]